jgi:hypothetical protein
MRAQTVIADYLFFRDGNLNFPSDGSTIAQERLPSRMSRSPNKISQQHCNLTWPSLDVHFMRISHEQF